MDISEPEGIEQTADKRMERDPSEHHANEEHQAEANVDSKSNIPTWIAIDLTDDAKWTRLDGIIRPPIMGYLCNRGFRRDECEDITQEILIKIYYWLIESSNEIITLFTVFSFSKNYLRNYFRKAENRYPHLDIDDQYDLEAPVENDEIDESILNALNSLNETDQNIFWLIAIEDYSHEETANLLQIPLKRIRSRFYGIRNRLRKLLGDYFNLDDGMP